MPSEQGASATGALLRSSPWQVNRRVLGALLIRELLTRYGRNNIGFLWLFVEPMLFTLAITAIWTATRGLHGSDIPIVAFALTGYSSILLWRNATSRCVDAYKTNMPLMYHRQVTLVDVYFARIILEVLAVSTSFVVLALALYAFGWLDPPEDVLQVLGGWVVLAWFAAGLALTVGSLSEKWHAVGRLWPPFAFILFILSGVAFLVETLPPSLREIALWLPMINALEYLREGWFGSQFTAYYNMGLAAAECLVLTFVGLSLARQVGLDASEE